jgi:hypothetical protein
MGCKAIKNSPVRAKQLLNVIYMNSCSMKLIVLCLLASPIPAKMKTSSELAFDLTAAEIETQYKNNL